MQGESDGKEEEDHQVVVLSIKTYLRAALPILLSLSTSSEENLDSQLSSGSATDAISKYAAGPDNEVLYVESLDPEAFSNAQGYLFSYICFKIFF
jgi:hypothetical protein